MANWSVVLARKPLLSRTKKARHQQQQHLSPVHSPSALDKLGDLMHADPPFTNHAGHIFKHLCHPEDGEHDCHESGCERITINVSGLQFVTKRAILEAHPSTKLGDPEKRRPYYDALREEYFFDRHRVTFESIFNYYKYGGKLKRPPSVSDDVFLDECEFFEVEESVIKEYKRDEGYTETVYEYPSNPFLAKIWALFEYPETSRLAFSIGIISVIMTLVSIVTFTVETLPRFKKVCTDIDLKVYDNYTFNLTSPHVNISEYHIPERKSFDYEQFFFVIESICNIWFTLEAVIRYISCPNKLLFWKDVKNIIDLVAIVPYYVSLAQMATAENQCEGGNDLAFLRVIRLIRVFKLTKHSAGLQILLLTFRSSMEGLTLFVLTLMVLVLVFSSTIYYCEIGEPETQIKSIPGGFWWAVITMCTVGYGDVVPVGTYGKIVGTVCALSGVLTLAIPVPIITENFNKFYCHKQRSKPRDPQKATLIEKVHKQISRMTNCCKETVQCKKSDEESTTQAAV